MTATEIEGTALIADALPSSNVGFQSLPQVAFRGGLDNWDRL
jgi:hypothetical protein